MDKLEIQLAAAQIKIEQRDRKIKEQEKKIEELEDMIEAFQREIINAISPEEQLRVFEKQFHSLKWHRKNRFL